MINKNNKKAVTPSTYTDLTKNISDHFATRFEIRKKLYDSPRFDEITDIIKREGLISQEDLKYHANLVKDLSYKEFSNYCQTLFWKKRNDVQELKPNLFEIQYKGISISLLLGQGSIYTAQKLNDE